MIDYIENSINGGRHLTAIRFLLSSASRALRLVPAERLKDLIAEGRMLVEYRANRPQAAEDVLYQLSCRQSPSAWAVTSYIERVVNLGLDRRLIAISQSKHISSGLLPLIVSAIKRRDGDLDGALQVLDYAADSYPVRKAVAFARRAIFHQLQDHQSIAVEGMKFLQEEPNQLLIPFTITTVGSAENLKRDDIVCFAVRRLLEDRDRIMNDSGLLRRFWKDAVTGSVTAFDIDGAVTILQRAKAMRIPDAAVRLHDLQQLRRETDDWRHVIDAARDSLRAKAYGEIRQRGDVQAELVVPAAAFRTNEIDYPGFRNELRFIVKTIAETLASSGISFGVTGRIRTHGELSCPVPSFSYHTISEDRKALHFKETDRPSRFSFDTGGYAGWSDFSSKSLQELDMASVNDKEALAYFQSEQVSIIGGNISKYAQAEPTFKEHLPDRFVFIGLQVIGDAVQELAYATPFEMMDEVIDTCLQQGLSVVVKRHPQDKNGQISDYLQNRENKGHITLSKGSIHTLIAKSEAVCVVNSGVGAEALLHEKPVYVFGKADYMLACFICGNPGDFSRQFKIGATALSRHELHRFWYVLRNRYAVSVIDRETSAKWIKERVLRHLEETGALSASSRT